MRITPWNYEADVLRYVNINILDNNRNVGRLTEVHPSSSIRNYYCISNRILGVDGILVNFVMATSDHKSESGDYDGYGNEKSMDADDLWRSVEEYEEHNESIKQKYRNRQRFIE